MYHNQINNIMKIYISSRFVNTSVDIIVAACAGPIKSYRADVTGNKYSIKQKAPSVLQLVYTDGFTFYENWAYVGHRIDESGDTLEVVFILL